jgi:hypothetical protein
VLTHSHVNTVLAEGQSSAAQKNVSKSVMQKHAFTVGEDGVCYLDSAKVGANSIAVVVDCKKASLPSGALVQ